MKVHDIWHSTVLFILLFRSGTGVSRRLLSVICLILFTTFLKKHDNTICCVLGLLLYPSLLEGDSHSWLLSVFGTTLRILVPLSVRCLLFVECLLVPLPFLEPDRLFNLRRHRPRVLTSSTIVSYPISLSVIRLPNSSMHH